jgi:hypothetical protein
MANSRYISRKSIEDFKSNLANGGVRPTMFEVQIVFPKIIRETFDIADSIVGDTRDVGGESGEQSGSAAELTEKSTFLVKASTLPGSNIGMIEVPFRGRRLKVSGDRTFNDWQTTVFNDSDYRMRDAIEKWSEVIQYHNFAIGHNQIDSGINNSIFGEEESGYMGTGFVRQLDRQGRQLKIYKFSGIWPVTIDDIGLDFGINDTIEEYGVTWAVQYWHANNEQNGPQNTGFAKPKNSKRKIIS